MGWSEKLIACIAPNMACRHFMYENDKITLYLNSVRCKNADDMELDLDLESTAMIAYSDSSTLTGISQMITMGPVVFYPLRLEKKHLSTI